MKKIALIMAMILAIPIVANADGYRGHRDRGRRHYDRHDHHHHYCPPPYPYAYPYPYPPTPYPYPYYGPAVPPPRDHWYFGYRNDKFQFGFGQTRPYGY